MFREQKRETSTMTVNKAGLVQLNIKSNSGSGSLRTTASTRLATTTRTSVPGFGIMAQRSAVGTGAIFNVKQYNSMSHSMLRHELNDNRVKVFNNVGGGYYMNLPSSNSSDNKFAAALMAVSTLASIAGTVIDALQSDDGAGTTNRTGSNNTTSSAAEDSSTTSLNDMKNADSSTELSAALTKAKADQQVIPGKLETANSELSTLKGQTDGLKSASEKAEGDYQQNLSDIKTKTEEVNTAQNSVTSCQTSYDSAKSNYEQAMLDSMKNPSDMNLRSAVTKAKQQMDRAEEQLKNAKTTLEQKQGELKGLQEKTEGLKQAAGDTKDAYDTNLKNIETKEKEVKQLTEDKKELDSEIPKQEKRLQELQKKEDSELDKVNKQVTSIQGDINKLMSSINVNDENGLSKKELKNKEKADAKQSELDRLKERQLELQKRKAIRNLPTENHNGIQFKTGYMPDGTVGYFVGGKEVSQTEYEAQLAQAKEANNS